MSTLWLIGMMGAGKSTVGPLVARRLGRPFVDLDERIVQDAGRSVAGIFEQEGEAGFRRRERAALAAVAGEPAVVACGGGAVLDPGNVARLRASGMVVWLEAPADELRARVGTGAGRPLWAGGEEGAVERMASAREAAYASAAHHRVGTAGRSAEEVAEEVERLWRRGR